MLTPALIQPETRLHIWPTQFSCSCYADSVDRSAGCDVDMRSEDSWRSASQDHSFVAPATTAVVLSNSLCVRIACLAFSTLRYNTTGPNCAMLAPKGCIEIGGKVGSTNLFVPVYLADRSSSITRALVSSCTIMEYKIYVFVYVRHHNPMPMKRGGN